jgi:hypothetical protein
MIRHGSIGRRSSPMPIDCPMRVCCWWGGRLTRRMSRMLSLLGELGTRPARCGAGVRARGTQPAQALGPGGERRGPRCDARARARGRRERGRVDGRDLDRADRASASYWVDTIERARTLVGDAWLGFVIGADQAVAFDRWREARRILELAEPVVLLREPWGSAGSLLDAMRDGWSDAELARWASWCVDVGTIGVSATEIRGLLRDGQRKRPARVDARAGRSWIDP